MTSPGPFTLAPVLLSKPWGGAALEPLLGIPACGQPQGEAWLLSDLASTSPSGAGGSAIESLIESGWGAGRSLHDLMSEHSTTILGRKADRFPLLLKLLEAKRHLSVQVHPSPAYAERTPGAHVKTEAWFALDSEGDASFMVGVRSQPSRETVARLSQSGEIGAEMMRTAVAPGDAVWIPSGTIHALGAGNLVFEVQTASDTTFRLYDWTNETGLPPRELHIEAALAATDFDVQPLWSRAASRRATDVVFDTPAFVLRTIGSGTHALVASSKSQGAVLLFPLGAGAVLSSPSGDYPLPSHRVTVVPAAIVSESSVNVPADVSVIGVDVR